MGILSFQLGLAFSRDVIYGDTFCPVHLPLLINSCGVTQHTKPQQRYFVHDRLAQSSEKALGRECVAQNLTASIKIQYS